MAKELPYFKFEPNQWDNGKIQMFSHEEKGVFIELCSMYWSRLGDLPYKLAVGKICNGNATALDSLYEEKVFDIINGDIFINFLSEQLNEFENTSKTNRQNAIDGWEKRRKQKELKDSTKKNNATALQPHSEPNAIREDKIKEDINNNTYTPKINFGGLLDFINSTMQRNFKTINKSTKSKFLARIKDGYTNTDIKNAIINASKDKFHKENNYKYLTPEYFSRASSLDLHCDISEIKKELKNDGYGSNKILL